MKFTLLFSGALLVLMFPFLSAARSNISAIPPKPLSFIENKGQVTDQEFHTRTDIDFKLDAPGVNIFIGAGSLRYQWIKNTDKALPADKMQPVQNHTMETYRLDVILEGANTNAEIIKTEEQAYFENYYLEQTPGGATAHAFNKVVYKDIYPHIDWVLYSRDNQLKYDFIVHPGGNVKDIRLKYEGATSLKAMNGAITVTTPLGQITEGKPYSYSAETKQAVASSFILNDNTLGFSAAATDGTLVIDPVLEWGTYFGDINEDRPNCVTTDNAGNVYMAGYTYSGSLATGGTHQLNIDGVSDGFIVKFSPSGQRLWATYYGGNFSDIIYGIVTEPGGTFYVTGATTSANGILTPGLKPFSGSGTDAFLAKFNSSGNRVWGTYYGGTGADQALGIARDRLGNIYITGSTESTTNIATPGTAQTALAGVTDMFLAKFSNNGSQLWGTYYGQFFAETGFGVACTDDGIYVCGETSSPNILMKPGVHQSTFGGTADGLLARFDYTGLLQWSTYYGGSAHDVAHSIACNRSGDVYIAGSTSSSTAIASAGAYQVTPNNTSLAGFLAKFSRSGVRQWGTYYSGNVNDEIEAVSASPDGYIYVTGYTMSATGIATPGSHQSTLAGSLDGFLAQFRENGDLVWASYYGGTAVDWPLSVANDPTGRTYICGYTTSTGLFTPGAFQVAPEGMQDGFLAKFVDTTVTIDQPFNDTIFCMPSVHNIAYSVQTSFRNGNTFTVQLSDTSGSFAAPVSIGSVTATTSGVITVTIPATTIPGNHYRMRIVASAPAYTSPDNGVDIHILPKAPVPDITGKTSVCTGDSIYLSIVNSVTGFPYQWTGPNGFSAAGTSMVIHAAGISASGDYIVATGAGACRVADTARVTVNPKPAAPFLRTNSPVCEGALLTLEAEQNEPNISFNWYGPKDFTSNFSNPMFTSAAEDNSGWYYVVITGANGCSSDSTRVYAKVIKLKPQISGGGIKYPGDTLILKSSVNEDSVGYTWTGPDGLYSNDTGIFLEDITKAAYGSYVLTVNYRGCIGTATADVVVSEIIHLYLLPNPNDGNFIVKGNVLDNDIIQMEVVDEAGRAWYRDSVKPFRKHFEKQIHLGDNLPNGAYILRTTVKDKRRNMRFVLLR